MAAIGLTTLTWTVTTIIFSIVWGDWDNPVAWAVYSNWSGLDSIVSRMLGLSG